MHSFFCFLSLSVSCSARFTGKSTHFTYAFVFTSNASSPVAVGRFTCIPLNRVTCTLFVSCIFLFVSLATTVCLLLSVAMVACFYSSLDSSFCSLFDFTLCHSVCSNFSSRLLFFALLLRESLSLLLARCVLMSVTLMTIS